MASGFSAVIRNGKGLELVKSRPRVSARVRLMPPFSGSPAAPNPHHTAHMKHKIATAAAVLCTALPAMGFIKMENKSTVNKDGSAKFTTTMELDLAGPMAMMGQAGGKNPLGDGKEMLVQMMKSMGGNVDVWSEAKSETTKGGATRVTMSGYTKDWRGMADLKKALAASGNSPIPLDDIPEIKFMDMKDDTAGNTVITMAGIDDLGNILEAARKYAIKEGKQPKPGDMKVDQDEIAQGLKQVRDQWAGIKGIVGTFVKGISIKSEIQVSGTISSSDVFKKTGENSATFTFTGDQLLSLADKIIEDEDLPSKIVEMAKIVEANFDNEKSTEAVKSFIEPYLKEVYGGSANPKIVIKPGADAFDYAAETDKAKAAQSDELKSLIDQSGKAGKAKLPGGAEAPVKKKAA